jgi:hypothetical protein
MIASIALPRSDFGDVDHASAISQRGRVKWLSISDQALPKSRIRFLDFAAHEGSTDKNRNEYGKDERRPYKSMAIEAPARNFFELLGDKFDQSRKLQYIGLLFRLNLGFREHRCVSVALIR